jgi:hypothetical protein
METEEAQTHEPSVLARVASFVATRYCTVDLRTLALFRIAFGILLLRDLFDWTLGWNGLNFFTDQGVLPAYGVLKAAIHQPEWGFMFGVTTPGQLHVAVGLMTAVYVAYMVGWHTRVMQCLVIVILLSLDHRDVLLQNGGVVAINTIAVFSAFLPLGGRFSLDAFKRPLPAEPVVERLPLGFLLFNFAAMHGLNALAKTGTNWRNGSAIHDMLWLNRFVTPMAGMIRMHEPSWFSPFFTSATLWVEFAIPILILLPFRQRLARRIAILFVFGLHFGISRLMELGPFPYAMMCASILLLAPEEWEEADTLLPARLRGLIDRVTPTLKGIFGPEDPAPLTPQQDKLAKIASMLGDLLATFIAVCCVMQILHENPVLPARIRVEKRPKLLAAVVDNLQLFQMWHMFAPQVFRTDGTLIVDGELEDGTHVDPFTGKPPDFEQALHGPLDYGQPWCDYFWRLGGVEFHKAYRPYLRDYLFRAHTLAGAKIDHPLKRFDVYWVSYRVPAMNSRTPTEIKRNLLFSSETTPAP